MARGNLFLGMGRGSVGDVTFYRSDGQQLSRARNRQPRNPKTQAQSYQRAVMATVVKAYQAGKEIFDHAFQGYSVGAQCQRQFLSLNARKLRELVSMDINSGSLPEEQVSRVVAPGVKTSVANNYIISSGSYAQRLFDYNQAALGFQMPQVEQGQGGSIETVGAYAMRNGLVAGDIYTLVVFAEREQPSYVPQFTDDSLAFLHDCEFGWVRMIVRSNLDSDNLPLNNMGQLFEFQSSGGSFRNVPNKISALAPGETITMPVMFDGLTGFLFTGGMGVIRSRLDADLRSDSVMFTNLGSDASDYFGIVPAYILDVWSPENAGIGHSELILEGGDA